MPASERNAQMRVRETEYDALKAAADAQGISLSTYLYTLVFNHSAGFTQFPRFTRIPRNHVVHSSPETELGKLWEP